MNKPRSCIGLLAAAVALTLAGCSSQKAVAPSDSTMTSDIQAKLFQDPVLKTRDIRVSTQGAVVTLAGTVNTDLEKAAVERLANQETGVRQVVDQLAVASASASTAPAPQAAAPAPSTLAAENPKSQPLHKPRKRHLAEAPAPAEPAAAAETAQAAPPPAQPEQASAPAPAPAPAPVAEQAPPPAPPPVTVTVPAGTVVTIRMVDGVDSASGQPGQQYAATVASPIAVGSQVVIPADSNATVRLVTVKSSGRFEGSAQLALELVSITANGAPYSVESTTYQQTGDSRGKRTAETVGGGSVLGGLIGAIAGGGKGAAIGAAIGAGAGGGVQAASKKNQVKVAPETKIDFTLKTPITVALSQ